MTKLTSIGSTSVGFKMKVVLMVAEKPSLAQSIAKILGNDRVSFRKGISSACGVHEYTGTFMGQKAKFKMTSVCGHVMTLDFKSQYNNWDAVEPQELFDAPTRKKEVNENLRICKFLEHEAKSVDYLVLWLDCDKEGENICFEVIDAVKNSMRYPNPGEKTIFRAKFSAITDKDIRNAMQNLGEPNKNEALSVDARQELDLRIGCAFTRFQTRFFHNKYGNLDSSLVSFGPCQTPTLGFCVERHDQIQSFKPETYWQIQAQVSTPSGQKLALEWERIRVFDKEVGNLFMNIVKGAKEAAVISVTSKQKHKQKPQALNTVELLRVASSALGIGPSQTMQIAERLYTQGYISYPRTETTQYSENFDLNGVVRQHSSNGSWGEQVRELMSTGIQKPRKGNDAGDHPPITPTRAVNQGELTGDSWRIYEYIVRHFLGTLAADCVYLQNVVTFEISGEIFIGSGKSLLSPGFTSFMNWLAITPDENLPSFKEGQMYEISEMKLAEKQTSPPDFLSESELITLMEKHGIGTDASIPVHINNICQRNYVQVTGSRRLVPNPLGIVLVHGYQKIDPELVLPTMRAAVEKQLNLIALGKVNFNSVLQHTIDIFEKKYEYFFKNISNMDELFEVSFTKLSETGKPYSRCGKCNRYMKYIMAKPCRLHCAHCDETYGLPQHGNIKLYKELRCPLDEFELLLWAGGPKGKCFAICPCCYNNPPFPGMKKGMGCNQCEHPTCKHGLGTLGVMDCPECEEGTLVFDPMSGPKWKFACNRCNVTAGAFNGASKVVILEESCDCGSAMVEAVYDKLKSPLSGGRVKLCGCPTCDDEVSGLIKFHLNIRFPQHSQRGRGGSFGSRGGGRRGRGRGRGRGRRGGGGGRGRGGGDSSKGDWDTEQDFKPRERVSLADFIK